ncbi:MAG: TM2 domain-containing protein [Quadrisphaera sp.]
MSNDDAYGRPPAVPGHQQPGQYGQPGQPAPYGQVQPYAAYGGQPLPPPGYGPGLTMFPQQYKDTTAAWLLWFFLGHLGGHDFYLRRTGSAVAKIALTLIGWVTVWVFIGIVPLAAVFVWWIVDAATMSGRLQHVNAQVYAHNRAISAAH